MNDFKDYIIDLTTKYDFPKESISQFVSAFQKIDALDTSKAIFLEQLTLYQNDIMFDYSGAFRKIRSCCDNCGIKCETGLLIFIICLTKHLKELHEKNNFESQMFDAVILDIKSKNDECFTIRKVYGTFVEDWFVPFFKLQRFSFDRFHFDPFYLPNKIVLGDKKLEKDDFVIYIHIPSGRPLDIKSCLNSLQMAYSFFAPLFNDGVVKFNCVSWILAPDNLKLLSNDSNIVKFMNLFKIIPSDRTIEKDFWRVFGLEDCSNPDTLPKDNSLRRAYADCIKNVNIPLCGNGIIFMKDGKILP